MATNDLGTVAAALVAPGKGILAADESIGTMSKRLTAVGIQASAEARRQWRTVIVGTPGLAEHTSGVILSDETFRQATDDGRPIPATAAEAGIAPGIKVDTGAMPLANAEGETVTEGLDGLRDRLAEYAEMGAVFAKWRAVIRIDATLPSQTCLTANAHALARYAALCQEAGIVPIVEPEVLMDGEHSIQRCAEVTEWTLREVFAALVSQRVRLEGMVLKPNMVVPAADCPDQESPEQVAVATARTLRRCVPAAVPGVAFLSGGQSQERATANLQAINAGGAQPWQLTFSFGRALLDPVLTAWKGEPANVETAQRTLLARTRLTAAARDGRYDPAMERT
ncbi:fructose-bisphosphate aldolase class I [soil metagenome]